MNGRASQKTGMEPRIQVNPPVWSRLCSNVRSRNRGIQRKTGHQPSWIGMPAFMDNIEKVVGCISTFKGAPFYVEYGKRQHLGRTG